MFGYKVKELEDKNFILVNGLGVSSGTGTGDTEYQAARMGLLTALLAAIFMTDTHKMNEGMDGHLHSIVSAHFCEPSFLCKDIVGQHKWLHHIPDGFPFTTSWFYEGWERMGHFSIQLISLSLMCYPLVGRMKEQ